MKGDSAQSRELIVLQEDRMDLNLSRYWYAISKGWLLILLTNLVLLTGAFLINRYQSKEYSIHALLLIEDSKKSVDPTEIIFGTNLNSSSEISNEAILLKTHPILYESFSRLEFFVTLYLEGTIRDKEYYGDQPFLLELVNTEVENLDKKIQVRFDPEIGENKFSYEITDLKQEEIICVGSASFGEEFCEILPMKIEVNQSFKLEEEEGREYYFSITPKESLAFKYQNRLHVESMEDESSVLKLSIEGSIQRKEIDFLNQLCAVFIENNLQKKNQISVNTLTFINQELARISDTLSAIELSIQEFKQVHKLSAMQGQVGFLLEEYKELENERGELAVKKLYIEYLDSALKGDAYPKDFLIVPASFGIDDNLFNNLAAAMGSLQSDLALVKQRDPDSKLIVELEAKLNNTVRAIKNAMMGIRQNIIIAENRIDRRILDLDSKVGRLPMMERQLLDIERLFDLNQNLFLLLLEKKAETQITNSSNTADVTVIEPARLSSLKPNSPNPTFNYIGALLMGLFLPIGFLVTREVVNDRVRTKDDLTLVVGNIPFIGSIISAKNKSVKYLVRHPKSALAESFRTLRSNLNFLMNQENGSRTIMVSSTIPGEGKTFVSANLAAAYAASGKKVVIVGADMRKPRLHSEFNIQNNSGLSSCLIGESKLEDAILPTEIEGLFILSSGPIPPNPADLLTKERIQELKHELSAFDVILFDTPPFGLVSDARFLMTECDVNIVVVRSDYSKYRDLKLVSELSEEGKLGTAALVLNDNSATGIYGTKYKSGYYQTEDGYYSD